MTYIPTCEINKPQFHTDPLGFTFVWNGHFLRGIFPESIELAKSYFDSGLIDEICSKELFPKTWISDFENEQFGLIIEHEFISPILYATEWNFEMLKDAALMVLELAQIAWKYGFNMVDCHKRNVLFYNNKPMYVDIGSFIPKEIGSTGWNPYMSYLHSYYYMLSLWSSGASVLAKRMMAPSLELDDYNYWVFKSLIFRRFPKMIKYYIQIQGTISAIAILGNEQISSKGKVVSFIKTIINWLKPSRSQRIHSMERKVKKMKRKRAVTTLPPESKEKVVGFVDLVSKVFPTANSIVFINSLRNGYFDSVLSQTAIKRIISIQEKEDNSDAEYLDTRKRQLQICSCHFRLKDNTVLIRGQFPEDRFCSDITFVPQFNTICEHFNMRNSVGYTELYLDFAKEAIVLGIKAKNEEFVGLLQKHHKVLYVPLNEKDSSQEGFLVVYK